MKFSFDLRIGDRTIRIEEEVAGEHQFWQRMAFWDSLPQAGPAGEKDLRFSYRTPKGYEYYAIESRASGQQFDFGQMNRPSKDLFPKSWSRIQHGLQEMHEEWTGNGFEDEAGAPAGSPPPPPPAPPAASPAPAAPPTPPPMRTGSPDLVALDGVIKELNEYQGAGKVSAQIGVWAKGRALAELNAAEIKQVLDYANGWLLASKKVASRQRAA